MSYYMVNRFDKSLTSFKTLKEAAEWMKGISLHNEIDRYQHFEIQEDFKELFRFRRTWEDTYQIYTSEGYLFNVTEEEFGPLYEVSMSNGALSPLPLGRMSWEAVLAVIGLYKGFQYRRAK